MTVYAPGTRLPYFVLLASHSIALVFGVLKRRTLNMKKWDPALVRSPGDCRAAVRNGSCPIS